MVKDVFMKLYVPTSSSVLMECFVGYPASQHPLKSTVQIERSSELNSFRVFRALAPVFPKAKIIPSLKPSKTEILPLAILLLR